MLSIGTKHPSAAMGVVSSTADSLNAKLTGYAQVVENQQALSSQFKHIGFFVPGVIGVRVVTSWVLGTHRMQTRYRNSSILRFFRQDIRWR